MSEGLSTMGSDPVVTVVDGVDLDAVTNAVLGCGGVDDLCSGPWGGGVVSYLPGRQVEGVRVASDHVLISVRGRWGVPVTELARQVQAALAPLIAPRRVDIVVADLSDAAAEAPAATPAAGVRSDEVSAWATSNHDGGPALAGEPAGRPGAPDRLAQAATAGHVRPHVEL
jgi:hypothetical protein